MERPPKGGGVTAVEASQPVLVFRPSGHAAPRGAVTVGTEVFPIDALPVATKAMT